MSRRKRAPYRGAGPPCYPQARRSTLGSRACQRDIDAMSLATWLAQGKTLLVISHDDRYFHLADQLIKLERGQIVHREASTQAAALQPVV